MAAPLMDSCRACSIIDRHLLKLEKATPSSGTSKRQSGRYSSNVKGEFSDSRSTARLPAILPAFSVGSRDGPSPFDDHKGGAQCLVDDVWASRQHFALRCAEENEAVNSATLSRQAAVKVPADHLVTSTAVMEDFIQATEAGALTNTWQPDYFKCVTQPPAIVAVPKEKMSSVDMSQVSNPLRDRLNLASERETKNGELFVKQMQRDRAGLYAKCVRNHPHGVLGIRESPYGPETGKLYAAHGKAMHRTHLRDSRKILGYAVNEPEDHLKGSIMIREDVAHRRQHVAVIAPRDHIFGGVNVD